MLRIIRFYVPMGISSLLAALTHVIINGVLARSPYPDATISTYAVALSLSFLIDMPMNAIRQASSKYARDKTSFRSVACLTAVVAGVMLAFSLIIGWTPAGGGLFRSVFGVKEELVSATVQVYQVLAFIYIFTAMRSLFQGVIINQLRTGWMTVGMGVRVGAMFGMSWLFIQKGWTNDGRIGAWIFLVGIMIECTVAVWEGMALRRKLPDIRTENTVDRTRQLLPFYMPLLYSSVIVVILNPSIQASLNNSQNPTLAVASYAVAIQLANMAAWFCASVHQIVIQFYRQEPRNVLIVVTCLSILSPLGLLAVSTVTGGGWLLEGVLGLKGELLEEVRVLLRFLSVQSALFPWIDFIAGKSMLHGKTRVILMGKICSVSISILLLILCVYRFPELNGSLAGIVTAAAAPIELLIVYMWFRRSSRSLILTESGRQA
jgi:progressive ankylosis protein